MEVKKPKIEVVSHDEIYLLDPDGNRTKRICGAKRDSIDEAFPCVEFSGKDTTHTGVGRCHLHDSKIALTPKNRNTYSILINPDGEKTVLELLDDSRTLEPEHSVSLDPEIQVLQSLLAFSLKDINNNTSISVKRLKDTAYLAEKLSRMKVNKIEAAKKAQLDFDVLKRLINGIFLAIKMNSSPEAAKRIISDIITTTIQPMMNKGDIGDGDVKELKSIPGEDDG